MTQTQSINQIVEFIEGHKDGISLYDLADKLNHLTEKEYSAFVNRAIKTKRVKLSGFKLYAKSISIQEEVC